MGSIARRGTAAAAALLIAIGMASPAAAGPGWIDRYDNGCSWSTYYDYYYPGDGSRGITGKTTNECNRWTQVRVSAFVNGSRQYSSYRSGKPLSQINWIPPSTQSPISWHKLCTSSGTSSCKTVQQF